MSNKKKAEKLGMNPSTASGRLIKDILFKFITDEGHRCFQCGGELTRETFSVEHKIPWLNSEDPVGLFFDLDNIAYSHKSCNYSAGTCTNRSTVPLRERKAAQWRKHVSRKPYCPKARADKYKRCGN